MTSPLDQSRAQMRAALQTIGDLRATLERERAERDVPDGVAQADPVAVVGRALRMPGGGNEVAAWWQQLVDGVDATGTFPDDRQDFDGYYDDDPDAPGMAFVRRGAFLDRVDGFDPAVFGISPREATGMDPQHRLALELSWEALEDAGIAPDSLTGSQTGVFLGVSTTDYARMRQRVGNRDDVDAYQLVAEPSFLAGRVSYTLGLQGPSSIVDTACSSSLVALHNAVRSLRSGECDLALVGGVNMLLDPYGFVLMSKFRALSPGGRCRPFDDAADGYARGEGGGIVVLQRLPDALRDGSRVFGVVAGTAVNHDGRSGGLTVPNPASQQEVIRTALRDAHMAATEVGVVEAHGTGTSLGDPIELRALDAVYGSGSGREDDLLVGSVKSNIGHLEAAAGIAGILKLLLQLEHRTLAPTINLTTPNTKIDWTRTRITVPTSTTAWPGTESTDSTNSTDSAAAAISSFGASGTNAHAILRAAPQSSAAAERRDPRAEAVLLSAADPAARDELAAAYAAALGAADGGTAADLTDLTDVAITTQHGRARFDLGLAVLADTTEAAARALRGHLTDGSHRDVRVGSRVPHRARRAAWLFTGQGSQYRGMSAGLMHLPAFARRVHECCAAFDPHLDRPLLDDLFAPSGDTVTDTATAQPALFTVEYALAGLLQDCGLHPSALLGHSVGEIAAATVAEVMTLADAARMVALRGRLMSALPAGGGMLAVAAGPGVLDDIAAELPDGVEVAARNSPTDLVLSGDRQPLDALRDELAGRQLRPVALTVSHAFHSHRIEPMLDEFAAGIADIEFRTPAIPMISNVTGTWWGPGEGDAAYWVRQARSAVNFADGVAELERDGLATFVEIGPHPVLAGLAERTVGSDTADTADTAFVPLLRRGSDDRRQLVDALARLDLRGLGVDWRPLHADRTTRRVGLPHYQWQRDRYWFTPVDPAVSSAEFVAGLGRRSGTSRPTWQGELERVLRSDGQTAGNDDILVGLAHRAASAAGCHGLASSDAHPVVHVPLPRDRSDWLLETTFTEADTDSDAAAGPVVLVHGASREQRDAGAAWVLHAEVQLGERFATAGEATDGDPRRSTTLWQPSSELLFAQVWDEAPPTPAEPAAPERVTLRGRPSPLADALQVEFEARGTTVRRTEDDDVPVDGLLVLTDPAALPSDADLRAGDLDALGLDAETGLVELVRTAHAADTAVRIAVLTRGACTPEPAQPTGCVAASGLWGLGRVLALEHPDLWGGIVDLDPDASAGDPATARAVVDALLHLEPEDQQALRGGRRLVPRIVPRPATTSEPTALRLGGTALITGGLGGIGLALARWYADAGGARVVLTSRNGEPDRDTERGRALQQLRTRGVDVRVEAVDVTDPTATTDLVARLASDATHPLRAVVHAAGLSEPQFVVDVEPEVYRRVWAPKVLGGWNLHEACVGAGADLDCFVLLSSVAATWGSQHLAAYAAGNAFLDALTDTRRRAGLPVTTLAWGPWDNRSELFGDDVVDFLTSIGLGLLAPQQCVALLAAAVTEAPSHRIVCAADWTRYLPVMEARRTRPMLSTVLGDDDGGAVTADGEAERAELLALTEPGARRDRIGARLQAVLAGVLDTDPGRITRDTDVFALGLDSLMVLEVATGCRRALGVDVPPRVLFAGNTLEAWTDYVESSLDGASEQTSEQPDTPAAITPRVSVPDDLVGYPPRHTTGLGNSVLLTGATGFVGAYLLRELLAEDDTREVVCLVRADATGSTTETVRQRVFDNAAQYFDTSVLDGTRVRVVLGDLTAPQLGLHEDDRAALARTITAVVHNGARVNFAYGYDQLAAANVGSVVEVLRLAAQAGAAVHHVSTYGIWGLPVDGRDEVDEPESIDTAGRLVTGYVQTKWAAEAVITEAARRGMPVATYRLGRVLGDSSSGAALTTHFTCRVIKSCIQLGAAPDLDLDVEMTPVDFVARALVGIAQRAPADGSVYHLVNPVHLPFAELIDELRRRGWPIATLPADHWWQRLLDTRGQVENELHTVLPTVEEFIVGGERAVHYRTTNADRTLAGTGIDCPPLDRRLLGLYLDWFVAHGYLTDPAPAQPITDASERNLVHA